MHYCKNCIARTCLIAFVPCEPVVMNILKRMNVRIFTKAYMHINEVFKYILGNIHTHIKRNLN